MKVKIIGDVHGLIQQYLHELNRTDDYNEAGYTIQLGDIGFNYDFLEGVDPKRHMFIGGNHDNYDQIDECKNYMGRYGIVKKAFGIQDDSSLVDYYNDAIFIGGAWSIDARYRTPKVDLWPEEEQLNEEEREDVLNLVESIKPNVIISHECPLFIARKIIGEARFDAGIAGSGLRCTSADTTKPFLEKVYEVRQPRLWIFGHHHRNITIVHHKTTFICLNSLNSTIVDL